MNATYHSRRICYSYRMGSTTFVEILNLETGEKSTWTEDEELMHSYWNLLLSDRHVVIFKAPRYGVTYLVQVLFVSSLRACLTVALADVPWRGIHTLYRNTQESFHVPFNMLLSRRTN